MTGSVNAKVEPWPGCECCVRSFFKAEGTLGGIHDRRSSPKKNPGIIAQGFKFIRRNERDDGMSAFAPKADLLSLTRFRGQFARQQF
jgi:hypothetical protein